MSEAAGNNTSVLPERPAASDKTTLNRQRAERRRAVARTVRDLRDRLSTGSGGRQVFIQELAQAYARTRLSAAFAIPLLIVLVGATALLWVSPVQVAGWAGLVIVAHVAGILLCRRFLSQPPANSAVRRWNLRFVAADLAYGIAWSGILILSSASTSTTPGLDVFLFATTVVGVSVGTMLGATLPATTVAGTLPVVVLASAVFIAKGEVLYYAMAALAAGAELFFLFLAGRFLSATEATLASRAEQDLLIGELSTAKAISDESRRRAEEANLAKSRFLATMSHELRTPLNAILGFSEVMKNEVLGPIENASYKEYAGDIHTSGQHLLNLINEILDLSRIEAGRYELHEEPVNLGYLVEDCRHYVELKARNKDITISEAIERDMPRLWADPRAVRQVVLNLLANAVKFTQPGGRIWIEVGWTAGGGQYVSIRDNGPGIPEEEIPIVLSAFGQGSIAIKSAEAGTGLGLPIVQALVRTHDGTFELASKLREGTKVTATFPRSRVMEALPPIDDKTAPAAARLRRAG